MLVYRAIVTIFPVLPAERDRAENLPSQTV
jgi:hypothetical protein